MPGKALEGVVALVQCSDPIHNARRAITQRLAAHGARVVQRLGKDVTHVVFERRRSQRAAGNTDEDAILSDLYRKLDTLRLPPVVVSPLWVEESITQDRRLMENRYALARPKVNHLAGTPGSAAGSKKRKQRSSGPALPRPAEKFDLDPMEFSSTQQINGEDAPKSSGLTAKRRARLRRSKAAEDAAAAARSTGLTPLKAGTATQAVADILVLDLPGKNMEEEEGEDDDELNTPLSVRIARQAGKRKKSRLAEEATAAGKAAEKVAEAHGLAQRFSLRQLERDPDRPVVLHKGTPLPGALPRAAGAGAGGNQAESLKPIPVPAVTRVESPWNQQLPSAGDPKEGTQSSADGRNQQKGNTPWTLFKQFSSERPLPSPWSAPRPWDAAQQLEQQQRGKSRLGSQQQQQWGEEEVPKSPDQADEDGMDEEVAAAADSATDRDEGEAQQAKENEGQNSKDSAQQQRRDKPVVGKKRSRAAAEAQAEPRQGPAHGCISVTSVSSSVEALCRSAARRLRGLRLCADGREDGNVTHLVIGEERRTMKTMLAVANGAHLVTPEWITASLEAGRWLPEADFRADVRFAAAADRARGRLTAPGAEQLLAQHLVHVCGGGNGVAAMRRVAAALGAAAAPLEACTLCVVVEGKQKGPSGGACRRPTGLPSGLPAVSEGWLLMAAETYNIPSFEQFAAST